MHDRDWQVLRELMELRNRFTNVLERVMMTPPPTLSSPASSAFEPAVDVWETDGEVIVEVELPGARRDDVEIRLERLQLIVSGQLPAAAGAEGRHLCVERPRGRFHRAIPLPGDVAGEPAATLSAGAGGPLSRSGGRRRRIAVAGGDA
jgi:HSP20 family protein